MVDTDSQDVLTRIWERLESIEHKTLRRWLRLHLLALAIFVILLFWLRPFDGDTPIYFWLPFAWGILAAVHFFVVATLTVDEAWTEERTLDVKIRSYDLGHMEDIRERHEDLHPSAVNQMELDRLKGEISDVSDSPSRSDDESVKK